MNYIGSKKRLLPFIQSTIYKTLSTEDLSDKVFCDLFAGTGVVGNHFKPQVKEVISNDLEYYSFILNTNYIQNNTELDTDHYFTILNELSIVDDGFIFKNYCKGGGTDRLYFSDHNGKKIDTIRQKIEEWYLSTEINDEIYYHLLASLIKSADKVANTASIYGSYLKKIKKSAHKELVLEPLGFRMNNGKNKVYFMDSNILIKDIEGDILYMDPPYNHRQYGSNYHLLNTIAEYSEFDPKGKTGLPEYNRSDYCIKSKALDSFKSLIEIANFKYIFLSYNNEGIMSMKEIKEVMSMYGEYRLESIDYQRFKADRDENRKFKADSTQEYLHILIK